MAEIHADLLKQFVEDPWQAHRFLFPHRHTEEASEAHKQLVQAIHASDPRRSIEGFRGMGKSTYLEEAAVIRAVHLRFRNMVIIGSSYSRACDRLASIKRELEMNELVAHLYGAQKGGTWQEGKIVLASGICIQALGRDQSMLGIKHFDSRPDAALVDDVEDPDEVRTDAEREQTWGWFIKTFLPALDHPTFSWVRVLGTRRGTGSLPERLEKDGWKVSKFPIEHPNKQGERTATWPSKFPLPVINEMRETYRGDMHTWMQEYMCQASSESDRVFTREMVRVEPRVKTWQACYAMIDPARTVGQKSATTGWAVWSWLRNPSRLVFWAADGQLLLPDEVVALAYDLHEKFDCVHVGVEEDGLNEWLLQPLRQEGVRRGMLLPLKAMRAPRGKLQFIRGMQPFFHAREVEFAQPMPVFAEQLISFPAGKIDVPNAAAYALLMRPGLPIYDSFGPEHIVEEPEYNRTKPVYLAANATGSMTAAVLVQAYDNRLVVLCDWVREGLPGELVQGIQNEAALFADTAQMVRKVEPRRQWQEMLKTAVPDSLVLRRTPPVWVLPPRHADRYMNVGFAQAIKAIPAEVKYGGNEVAGQQNPAKALAEYYEAHRRSRSTHCAMDAQSYGRWIHSLNGQRRMRLQDYAEEGPYRLLMEGLESFVGIAQRKLARGDDEEDMDNYSTDRHGRRYKSAMPAR